MSTPRRCAKCDGLVDSDQPNSNPATVFGDSECSNPVCNPKKAEELAARLKQEADDRAAFEEWKKKKVEKKPEGNDGK